MIRGIFSACCSGPRTQRHEPALPIRPGAFGGVPTYHTNISMCIGIEFALIGLGTISDPAPKGA